MKRFLVSLRETEPQIAIVKAKTKAGARAIVQDWINTGESPEDHGIEFQVVYSEYEIEKVEEEAA